MIYDILNIQPRFHHYHKKFFFGSPLGDPKGSFGVFVSRQNGRKVGVDVVLPRLALPPETTQATQVPGVGRCLESSANLAKKGPMV